MVNKLLSLIFKQICLLNFGSYKTINTFLNLKYCLVINNLYYIIQQMSKRYFSLPWGVLKSAKFQIISPRNGIPFPINESNVLKCSWSKLT